MVNGKKCPPFFRQIFSIFIRVGTGTGASLQFWIKDTAKNADLTGPRSGSLTLLLWKCKLALNLKRSCLVK
jgi:hypothetical protein